MDKNELISLNIKDEFNNLIKLRPINIMDTDNIIKWRNNPLVKNKFIFRDDLTKESHLNWIKNKIEKGLVIQYIIEYNKIPVGSIYFRDINYKCRFAEIGIFIGEDKYRGKGIGSLALKKYISFGFKNLKFCKIFLRVLKNNKIAINVYRKIGFRIIDNIENNNDTIIFMEINNYDILEN